jgi:hypothetical protein
MCSFQRFQLFKDLSINVEVYYFQKIKKFTSFRDKYLVKCNYKGDDNLKNLRNVFCLLFICLIAIPANAHGQENVQVEKSLISKITTSTIPGNFPKKSLSANQSYSPADYPLKTNGSYVDSLLDSWYSYHDITFETVSSYSSTDLNVQILYDSEYSVYKDSIITVEFLKNNGGTLEYIDSTEFDTYGYWLL